ncbi:MAG: adenylate/guanylate cyclase domain-containing protein [Anaerolineales bacterium]
MNSKSVQDQIRNLQEAIRAQEALRPTLGDAMVDTVVNALQSQLNELQKQIARPEVSTETRRKQVTVLFADVSGFTALSENMDAEDVANLVNRIWARLDRIIEENGGQIDKHIGDAVMALWGAENSREDDSERAIRAALRMQEEFKKETVDLPINIKIGINSGLVLLSSIGSHGEFTAIGDTVNTASRLVSAAGAGMLLISYETYQMVRGIFDVQKQDLIAVKGKSEPLQTYIVQGIRPRAFRMGRRGVEGISTRMVGRDLEINLMQNVYEQTLLDRRATVFVVKGDAGLGKSRLVYEFEGWLDTHPTFFYLFKGRADEESQNLPYSLLRDVFSERFQIMDSDTQTEAREKIVQGIAALAGEGTEEEAAFIGHLIGFDFSSSPYLRGILTDAKQIRTVAFSYIARFFEDLSAKAPVVLLLDDIHWADNGSLELLAHLAALEVDLPLFILCATRPSLNDLHPNWGHDFPRFHETEINTLDIEASRQLVNEILKYVPDLPKELVDTVARNAEGNPFYLEELVKVLIEDGVIVKGDEEWHVEAQMLTQVRVPSTLTGVLQARLDRLPSPESDVLERAAVIGRTFWEDAAISSMNGSEAARTVTGTDDVTTALRALRNKELVFSHQPSAFASTQEYIFKHAILREVTYERVLKAKRKLYHRMAAEWLIQQSGERLNEYLALIAQHYELAGDSQLAIDFLERAGLQSMRLSAYRESLTAFERAMGIIASSENNDPSIRARLLLHIGRAHLWLTDHAVAQARFEECLALASLAHDRGLELRALAQLGRIQLELGNFSEVYPYAEKSLEIANDLHDEEMVAYNLAHLGYVSHYESRYTEARNYGEASYESATKTGDMLAQAFALNVLAMISVNMNEFEQSQNYHLRAIEICKKSGDRYGLARAYANLSEGLRVQRRFEDVKPYALNSVAIARELGNTYSLSIMLINLLYAQVWLEEIEDAYETLREALRLNLQHKTVGWVLYSLSGYAYILMSQGLRSEALHVMGMCLNNPELNSDTKRDIDLILQELRTVRTDDIETELEKGKSLNLDEVVNRVLAG